MNFSRTIFVWLLCAAPVVAKTYHVAPERIRSLSASVQFSTIQEAASRVRAGDTVVIHGGVYREAVRVNTDGRADAPIRFKAAPGEKVEVCGADLLTDWRPIDESGDQYRYRALWPTADGAPWREQVHPDDDYHKLVGRREQLHVQSVPLRPVLSRDKLERGTFYFDTKSGQVDFWPVFNADLMREGKPIVEFAVEASVRSVLWQNTGDHIHVKGIDFCLAANPAQRGAVEIEGKHNLLENCVFERNSGYGLFLKATNAIVRRCQIRNNLQLGFGASLAHNGLLTECVVSGNGWEGFKLGWEGGGSKIVFSRNFDIERSVVARNRGNGIWYDIGNIDNEVRNCLITDNQACGIFYEISYSLHAHDNVIVRNGLRANYTAWGASAGISLSSSPGCLIERNLLIGNKEGFTFREQLRATPTIEQKESGEDVYRTAKEDPIWNHDHLVRNNLFANNRDVQVRGWFAVSDGRHWPAETQTELEAEVGHDAEGWPSHLTLEKLNLRLEDNVYATSRGAVPLFRWGVNWDKNETYTSLQEVQKRLGLENGSVESSVIFKDATALDLRVAADSLLIGRGVYPRGRVPRVRLGPL